MSATTNISIFVQSPASTAVTFTPSAPSFTAPVAAGTVMGTMSVTPSGWAGTMTLSGADASSFTLNTNLQLVAAVDLAAKTYSLTVDVNP